MYNETLAVRLPHCKHTSVGEALLFDLEYVLYGARICHKMLEGRVVEGRVVEDRAVEGRRVVLWASPSEWERHLILSW